MGIGIATILMYKHLREQGYFNNFKSVIELGSQEIPFDKEQISQLVEDFFGYVLTEETPVTAKTLYKSMGLELYQCIDADGCHNALVFDLNKDIQQVYGFIEQFDLVTNHGTTEHCFDQYHCFMNIHNLCRAGGLMIHVLPIQGWINHGLYNYQPSFFYNLAAVNCYQIIKVYLSIYRPGDIFSYSIPKLIPYTEKVMDFLFFIDSEHTNMVMYVVLQKKWENTFSMPYDNHYINHSILPNYNEYLAQTENREQIPLVAPEFAKEYAKVGSDFFKITKIEEAYELYLKAVEMEPNNAKFNANMGSLCCYKSQLDVAIKYYYKAIEIDPTLAEAYCNLKSSFTSAR